MTRSLRRSIAQQRRKPISMTLLRRSVAPPPGCCSRNSFYLWLFLCQSRLPRRFAEE
ncbi:MAG: hypothetical protein JNJ94_13275 [Chlorobi bacterium]|nr:hypothetical protein [Chlorobiota bacterium]